MIICFSGTGNTRFVADQLQELLGDDILRFAPGQMINPERIKLQITDKRVIWAFPVHGWGLPKRVVRILKEGSFLAKPDVEHYMVATCGDDLGYTDHQWRKLLKKKKLNPRGAYSVQMPNTYTLLPGFDVDSQDVANAKLEACVARVEEIAAAIESSDNNTDVVRGSYPWIKSKIFYPFFHRFLCSTKPFHYTENCGGCGKCARNCSTSNITMIDNRPHWGKDCTMCLRCYHSCPRHAAAYGRYTKNKGQYLCPGYSLSN